MSDVFILYILVILGRVLRKVGDLKAVYQSPRKLLPRKVIIINLKKHLTFTSNGSTKIWREINSRRGRKRFPRVRDLGNQG